MADRNLIRRLQWTTLALALVASAPLTAAHSEEPVTAAPGQAIREPAAQGYPESEAVTVMTDDEKKIRDLRNEEIEQLRITLARRQPDTRRADLYLRLAELYIEAYRFEFLVEGRIHEIRLEKGRNEKNIDHGRSRPYLQLAIQACQDIIDFRIQYEHMDQVLYFLAYNYNELGDEEKARKYYGELVRRYASSSFAVEGLRELGEAAFQNRDYRNALPYFENVLARSSQAPGFESQLPRVRHRIAWCRYRLKQYDKAVYEMKEAIRLAGLGKEKLLSVKEEALRDLAIFMTESGNVSEAITFFQKAAGDQQFYPRVLESLGRQYERNVEPVKATQVYESLLMTHPKDEAAFRVRVKLVDLDLRRGRTAQALERIKGVKLYASSEGETDTAWQNLRAMIRRTATESHEKYRKESDRKALETADQFYQAYLDPILVLADPRKETPEIQMYLADVKRERGLSKEASALYRKVVDSADKRYAKEAAALWTASLADAIRKESQNEKATGSTVVRSDATALEQEFVQAADDLNDALKDTVEARESRLKAAQVLAAYPNSQKTALKRIRGLMSEYPRSGQAITAARLWIQIYADRITAGEKKEKAGKDSRNGAEDLRDAIQEIRGYTEVVAFDQEHGGKLKSAIAEQEGRLKVLDIAFREKDQDYKGAAKLYEKYAEDSQDKEAMSKAYENAVASWLRINDLESADRVVQAWQKKVPDSKVAAQAMRNSATLLFIQGKFEGSAGVLERLGSFSKDPDALELAIRITAAISQDNSDSLNSLVNKFVQTFPQSPARSRVLLLLARRQESQQLDALAAQSYKQCLAVAGSEEEGECALRLGQLYQRLGNHEESRTALKKAATIASKGTGAFFSLWARLELARLADSEVVSPKLTRDGLAKDLPKRLQAFEAVQKAYAPVLEAGGGFSVPASRRLGQVALELAAEMEAIASSDPKAAKIVETLRSTAAQFFKQSKQKAQEGEWISPELPKLVMELDLAEKAASAQGTAPEFSMIEYLRFGQGEDSISKLRDQLSQNAREASLWGRYGLWLAREFKNDGLAAVAFDRVLSIQPKNVAAINNLAVLKARSSADALENPWTATQVAGLLKEAGAMETEAAVARANRAQLLNYYAIFPLAKKIWEQVQLKDRSPLAEDGLGISLQGIGNVPLAKSAFTRAREAGADPKRFAQRFHEASAVAMQNPDTCLDLLSSMRKPTREFERQAATKLEETCKLWKQQIMPKRN
jgi:tetratricopeptide (TPR) repeat protein